MRKKYALVRYTYYPLFTHIHMFKGSTFSKAVYTEAPPRAVGGGAARAAPLFLMPYIRPLTP